MKSFWGVVRVEWAVLKERVERLEPGAGEGIRGVWYWDWEERRDDGWFARVGEARGFVGLRGVSRILL